MDCCLKDTAHDTENGGLAVALAMRSDVNAHHKPLTLRERARRGVGDFRWGRVVAIDEEVGCVEDVAGHRYDLSRTIVDKSLFDHLRVGNRVLFRENAFHSVAEIELA